MKTTNETNTLTPANFDFNGHTLRQSVREDGEPIFVAKDVCDILDIKNAPDTLAKVLEDDEKGIATIYTLGGPQNLLCVTESGLYALIFKSRKAEAKEFRKWVTSEVLPAIRKTGKYEVAAKPAIAFPMQAGCMTMPQLSMFLEDSRVADTEKLLSDCGLIYKPSSWTGYRLTPEGRRHGMELLPRGEVLPNQFTKVKIVWGQSVLDALAEKMKALNSLGLSEAEPAS